jgi:hypothetical protein
LLLSAVPKPRQFNSKLCPFLRLGNVIVLPAATCVTLVVLFALPPSRGVDESAATHTEAWRLAGPACGAVLSC